MEKQKFCLDASECRIYQRGAHPAPLSSFRAELPELSAHTSLPSHCSLFLFLSRPHLFICPAGCATKTPAPSSKWSSYPHMLCSAHFPTPQRQTLGAKDKMRKRIEGARKDGGEITKVRKCGRMCEKEMEKIFVFQGVHMLWVQECQANISQTVLHFLYIENSTEKRVVTGISGELSLLSVVFEPLAFRGQLQQGLRSCVSVIMRSITGNKSHQVQMDWIT